MDQKEELKYVFPTFPDAPFYDDQSDCDWNDTYDPRMKKAEYPAEKKILLSILSRKLSLSSRSGFHVKRVFIIESIFTDPCFTISVDCFALNYQ
jgi:hypothetical protein